jgi:hypothetical protein
MLRRLLVLKILQVVSPRSLSILACLESDLQAFVPPSLLPCLLLEWGNFAQSMMEELCVQELVSIGQQFQSIVSVEWCQGIARSRTPGHRGGYPWQPLPRR